MNPGGLNAQYLFGDSDIAAQRLEALAGVFRESTRTFLAKQASGAYWPRAIDLGCGPGFTSQLIADTLRCGEVVGLDSSAGFVDSARKDAGANVSYALHDVTTVPFPGGPADIIFCRFLLTHLQERSATVARWAGQVNHRGLLMIEEAETIRTQHQLFRRYIEVVESILASRSNRLFAGPALAAVEEPAAMEVQSMELHLVPVRNCDAARLFALNLKTLKHAEFAKANYSPHFLLELEHSLAQVAAAESQAQEIVWTMRQAAWRKI